MNLGETLYDMNARLMKLIYIDDQVADKIYIPILHNYNNFLGDVLIRKRNMLEDMIERQGD